MKTLFTIVTLWLCAEVRAQVFPVQVHIQLAPPYSPYLGDYTTPGAQNLSIQVIANDLTLQDYPCKLRITIEGVGISMRTKQNFSAAPILLQGGSTHLFYGEDLSDYLEPGALDFSGISQTAYLEMTRLPEGIYSFSVEVLDYNRGTVVSNAGTATAWILLNDPPILNTPANLASVPVHNPGNILFTWTPRHSGSPNAAFSTQYTFRLIELWPDHLDPNNAFLSQPPLYETTTTVNFLMYDVQAPSLLPGKRYAWQVQAIDTEGRDLFRNQGRSEVFVFRYGDVLAIPGNLRMRWAKPTTLAIQWDAVTPAQEDVRYRLQYRPRRRSESREWYETWTRFTDKTLYHLASNTEYEMRIRSETAMQESAYSDIRVFKTLHEEAEQFVCRDDIEPPPAPENTLPVFPLSVNDTIHAGGYEVIVRDVIKSGSRYFGSGVAIVPWFNSSRVRVTFENIRVNDRYWLTSGVIRSIWNSESEFHYEEQTPITPGNAPQTGELDITVVAADTIIRVRGSAIAAVTTDDEGNIIITTIDGNAQVMEPGTSAAIVDEMGNGYIVDEKGNIAKTTAEEAMASAARGNRNYDANVRFSKGAARFGFDEKNHDALSLYYQQTSDGSFIPWKALSSTSTDVVDVTFGSDTDSAAFVFELGGAQLPTRETRFRTITLTLQGKAGGMEEELLVVQNATDTLPEKIVGKLNTVTYDPLRRHLVLVPVNGSGLPSGLDGIGVAQYLNSVYNQAVVEWSVSVADDLKVPMDGEFDEGDTRLLSNYTPDMKKVLNAFGLFQDDFFYLFIVKASRNPATLGYMPRSRQAGFIFSASHGNDIALFLKTIAHELGHGAFNLRHTFSEHNLPEGITDNLMDYSGGHALYKYQWDYIHQPQKVLGLFETSEEGTSVKSELISFYEKAAPSLQEPHYKQWVEKVRTLANFFRDCEDEGWKSYKQSGVIPYCFWRDRTIPPALNYTAADVAFMAGLIDGGYVELEGVYHLPDIVSDLSNLPGKLIYSYTLAYWECRTEQIFANIEEYEYVVEELANIENEGGIWNWLREQWHDFRGEKEKIEQYFKDCKDAEELRQTIDDLYDLITNWSELTALSEQVIGALSVYWETLESDDNYGRYERGRLIVPTAALVVPFGIGVSTKLEKLKTALVRLHKASKDNLQQIARQLGEAMGNKSLKLSQELKKIYDDCLKAGYAGVREGDELFLSKNGIVVAKISDNALHIKIPDNHGAWARQSTTENALRALENAKSEGLLYRIGSLKTSAGPEAQYWSFENPLQFEDIKLFSKRYGIPEQNLKSTKIFVEVGRVKKNIPIITRESPGVGNNLGGQIELVVPAYGVELEAFHTITF